MEFLEKIIINFFQYSSDTTKIIIVILILVFMLVKKIINNRSEEKKININIDKIDGINKRLVDCIDNKLDKIYTKLGNISGEISSLKTRTDDIWKKV